MIRFIAGIIVGQIVLLIALCMCKAGGDDGEV